MRFELKGKLPSQESKGGELPVIGKIKTGKRGETGLPTSTGYFIPKGKYASKFTEVYGDTPEKITILFMSHEAPKVCNTYREYRDKAGKLVAITDEESYYLFNPNKGAMGSYLPSTKDEVGGTIKTKYRGGKWKVQLKLTFVIPAISGVMGQWELITAGEESSIPNITKAFFFVSNHLGEDMAKRVTFDLTVEKVKSNKPGLKNVYSVINLVPNVSIENQETAIGFLPEGASIKAIGPSKEGGDNAGS